VEAVLKGSEIKSVEDFHTQIKELLELPDYYGKNLDALWDCMSGWVNMPLKLIWIDYKITKNNIGDFADRALKLFDDAQKEIKGFSFECK
jgi:ribonuclease inhibitor